MKQIKSVLSALSAASLLAFSASANAGFFTSTMTNGVNIYEDQSREAYIDVDGDGTFNAGDVLVGFARLDDRTSLPPVDLNNSTYAIFTQQVDFISGTTVFWKPTIEAGLTLNALTGVGGANDMVALFSSGAAGYGVNLIDTSPGDTTGVGGITLKDYFQYILNGGTLDMVLGLNGPGCSLATVSGSAVDCFQASSAFAGGSNSGFVNLGAGVTVANFVAGLTSNIDPVGVDIVTDGTASGAYYAPNGNVYFSDVALSNGAVQGSVGAVNQSQWVNASELTAKGQCLVNGVSTPCGFINDVDFVFNARVVPEPASLALVGLGLLGVAGLRRRRA